MPPSGTRVHPGPARGAGGAIFRRPGGPRQLAAPRDATVWHPRAMPGESFEVRPFPRGRGEIVDALEVGVRRHMVHALLELDVTHPRRLLREHAARTGERLSFTAFIVASLARAIDQDRRLHACRDWRGRLVLFDEVDVVTLIESEVDEVAIPHVLRAANRRALRELHEEIRAVQAVPGRSAQRSGALARLSRFTPGVLRRLFLRVLRRSPGLMKRSAGTTLVTSIGMFGAGAAWPVGIVPLHTACLAVGGISVRPGWVEGRVEPRELLALTASVDHDLVDGAPAARFVKHLREIVERGEVLPAPAGADRP